jgi:predicted enzyme related to lactoylglutathione lyase
VTIFNFTLFWCLLILVSCLFSLYDAPGIHGAIMHRHFSQAVINTVEVDSLEETLQKIAAAGGKKIHGPEEIPGVGTHAYCEDPEGNLFGVMQPDRPPD